MKNPFLTWKLSFWFLPHPTIVFYTWERSDPKILAFYDTFKKNPFFLERMKHFPSYMVLGSWGGSYTIRTSVFSGYIPQNPLKKVTVERFLKFQVLLTSFWERFRRKIPGEKRKFRRAARAGHNSRGGKNKRKSFLILVSSDQRPHRGVFRPKGCFWVNFQKHMLICTQKCDSWEIKKRSRR